MKDADIVAFSEKVIEEERLFGWRMEWEKIDDFGMCFYELKYFTIPVRLIDNADWVVKEYVLHEVAHAISDCKGSSLDNPHGFFFYSKYIYLLNKYMLTNN